MEDDASATHSDMNKPSDMDMEQSTGNSESVLSPAVSDIVKSETWTQHSAGDGLQALADGAQHSDALAPGVEANKVKKRSRKPAPLGKS